MNSSDDTNASDPLVVPLSQLDRGDVALVSRLAPVAGLAGEQAESLIARLRDLGFVAGARCEVIARMWPAGDPVAVRIGGSTFALRRVEAEAVRVSRVGPVSHVSLARGSGAVTA